MRLKSGDSRMSMRTARGVSNAVPLNAPWEVSALESEGPPVGMSVLLVSMINSRSDLARERIFANKLISGLMPATVACLNLVADRAAEQLVDLVDLTGAGDEKAEPMTMPKTWIPWQCSTTSLSAAGESRGR